MVAAPPSTGQNQRAITFALSDVGEMAQSDLIVTIPAPLARYFSTVSADLRVVGMPFGPPRIALKQFWHRKFHDDVRNRWLRTLLCRLFQDQRDRGALDSEHATRPHQNS